jgi:hypothetical protein
MNLLRIGGQHLNVGKKNPNLMFSNQRNSHRHGSKFINNRTIGNTQKQVFQEHYQMRKYSNTKYVRRIVLAYKNLTKLTGGLSADGKLNYTMRYGLPSKSEQYIVEQYLKLCSYVKKHSQDKANSATRQLATRLEHIIYTTKPKHYVSKASMYNIRLPRTMVAEIKEESYNGERIHIPLKEVL